MPKKTLFSIAFILFFLLLYAINTSADLKSSKPLQVQQEKHKILGVPIKQTIATVKKSPKTISKSVPHSKTNMSKNQKKIPLYESITFEEASLTTKARKYIKPISAIQMNPHALKQLNIQDTIVLTDIKGFDYPLTVTHIQTNNDGSVTMTASYTDEGIGYTTTMTQSDNEGFISLATAQGLYEIETRNGVGYVYKTDDIRKQMQDTSLSDVIMLPIPQSTQN